MERKKQKTNCVVPSFSWSYTFLLFSLGLC